MAEVLNQPFVAILVAMGIIGFLALFTWMLSDG